ncbi:hypothetical protein L798_11100 [Zootermopsis nevadensis]|uniref:Uncharacterized protein n=1 Tax=Zootermopsis nevadensis TaxID=136037 RepID=A0A067R6T7_ZOONE|nr:hypothetical protein L798_11100 [Zootermopsis nevadensis]
MASKLENKVSKEKKKKMFYFPYLYSQRENNTLYGEVITIEVLNGGLVQFSGEYEIYIIPKPLNCIPYLEIKDCGRSTEEMCKWERAKEHTVRGHVKRCYESSELKYIWGIFTMSKEVPFPLYKTLEGAKTKSNLISLDEKRNEYTIEPYNMSYGDYGFLHQVVRKSNETSEYFMPTDSDMVRTLNSHV